ncbi:hypothetical protein PS662_01448 [Pseudomonas fluorescens]|uniref:Alpha-2 type XI collagen n=1 Tax=Pseudomonas fluorescens TaxID=294 RepID=A0A5E6RII9_PSEFL|nr:DUF4381 domain-containing protein [Pseudomonas fluorescens]VVM63928.1 hypothetical protein PS662_01448 [Pseudomonas fluorescens]
MNPNIPSIEQLKEIALPAPVSYAPQTWGWWVLLALLIGAGLGVGARRYWQWRRDRYRREALVRLAELQSSADQISALRELPELLKRVALSMPSTRITTPVGAGLPAMGPLKFALPLRTPSLASQLPQGPAVLGGTDWQVFLQRHSAQPLPADFSQQLAQLAYAPDATLLALPGDQRQQLFDTCRRWVEHHHVAA